ncbi:pentapeptide repeat-containing protein [Streptomyces sp. NPDC048479]|uniref:WD40 repeat domain-containing protein n=1 Tax=Streptomyces sp. NPDC048479 TaxID=3154725 RepID=UPI00343FBED1
MRERGADLQARRESFRYASRTGRLVIILDGLDELRWQLTAEHAPTTLAQLADLVSPKSKIPLASRPGYFERERSTLRSADFAAAGSALVLDAEGRSTFEVVRLADLGYEQRVQALVRRLGTAAEEVRRLIDSSSALTDLARLPGLLCTTLRAGDLSALDRHLLLPEPVAYLAEQLASEGLSPLDWLPEPDSALVRDHDPGPADSAQGGHLAANCLSLANRMGATLSERSFRGLDLRGADLQGADLRRSDLRDCDLRSVLLQGAVVADADLRHARLHGAILHETQVVAVVAMLPGDGGVAAGTADGLVHLLDPTTLATEQTMRCPGAFRNLALLSYGRYVVVAGLDGSIYLADRESAQAFLEIAHHGAPANSSVAVSDDTFASGGTDGTVRLWNLDGDELWQRRVTGGYVRSLAVDPEAGLLFAGSSAGEVSVLSVTNGQQQRVWIPHPGAGVYSLCALAAKGWVASGSDDRTIRFYSQSDGTHVANLAELGDTVLALVHDPGTDAMLAGCRDGTLSSWNLTRREPQWSVAQTCPILALALNTKDCVVATAGADGMVRIFDSRDGSPLAERLIGRRSEVAWQGVDLRGTSGWHKEWLRFMGERGAVLDT